MVDEKEQQTEKNSALAPRALVLGGLALSVLVFVSTDGFGLLGEDEVGRRRAPSRSAAARRVNTGGALQPEAAMGLQVGAPAPALSLPDQSGVMHGLEAWKGRPVVLNVWATWCPPCIQEMPSLEVLHAGEGEDFRLITVAVDDEPAAARNLAQLMGLSFPVLFDPGGSELAQWGTTKFPETWILDSEGVVVERVIGGLDWANPGIRTRLKKLADTGEW